MTVKLPGTYTGRQVVEAFKKSCSLNNQEKYLVKERVEYQYEPGSVKQTVKVSRIGFVQIVSNLGKKFLFFGPAVEVYKSERRVIELDPIHLGETYSEVEVKFPDPDSYNSFRDYITPNDSEFSEIRAVVEGVIGNFYKELQPSIPA